MLWDRNAVALVCWNAVALVWFGWVQKSKKKNRRLQKVSVAKLSASCSIVIIFLTELRNKYEGKSPSGSPKKRITTETKLRRKELKRRRAAQLAIGKNTILAYFSFTRTSTNNSFVTDRENSSSRPAFIYASFVTDKIQHQGLVQILTLKAPNKNCSRWHFNFLLLSFKKIRLDFSCESSA